MGRVDTEQDRMKRLLDSVGAVADANRTLHDTAIEDDLAAHASMYGEVATLLEIAADCIRRACAVVEEAEGE